MKKVILLVGLFVFYQNSYGQCDKAITFKCNKARSLKDGSIGEELPIDATIIIDRGKIILTGTVNGESEKVEGEIKEISLCSWTDYLKDGKTQYKALTKKDDENPDNSIIEVESKNGYTKITFGSDPDTGSKLQFDVTEYTITDDANANQPLDKSIQQMKKQKRKSKAITK